MSLTVSKVDKSYGKLKALDEISLCFEPGNIYGLFGRNGAGKSTLCNLMTGRALPDQGLIHLDGSDLVSDSRIVRRVALVNETWPYPSRRHIRQAFAMAEGFYGDFDWHLAESILKSFALRLTDTFASLSTGQRQVVKDIIGLCLPVEYLILDEPTTGMDAAARERIYSFLLEAYQRRGPTMIIATHILNEVSQLISRATIIDQGRVLRSFSVDDLSVLGTTVTGRPRDVESYLAQGDPQLLSRQRIGDLLRVSFEGPVPDEQPKGLIVAPMDLQTYFVQITEGATQ